MSPLELLAPQAAEEAVPFSARLAERRLVVPARISSPPDRRMHQRRTASDLAWLQSVRLTGGTGYGVRLIDLSEGGALIEVDAPLRPGVRLTLELAGSGLDAAVPLEVLRSYVARLKGDSTFYRGACMFAHAIELPSAGAIPPPPPKTPFVGTGAALQYLLDRCDRDASARVALARGDLMKVLESIHARGAVPGDTLGRGTLELLGAVLPALQRGRSARDAAAALECRYRTLPRQMQTDLLDASRTIEALIARCLPAIESPAAIEPAPEPQAAADEQAPTADAPAAADTTSAMQKIVVRYVNGDLLKGFTQDFHPSRAQFSLWPSITAKASDRVVVPMSRLKAVFFVRDFQGNPAYRERKTLPVRGQGRRIEVTFADTEVIQGTTLNYRPDGQGFFIVPADTSTNNTRIFVIAAAVKRVRFL